jgi:hypothetical protein
MYYKELMVAYPEAKVILSVRDSGQAWYNSALKFSLAFHPAIFKFGGAKLFYSMNPVGMYIYTMLYKSYLHHFDDPGDMQLTIKQYEDWIDGVKTHVPTEKLLVFNVKDGWPSLCAFLGVSQADCPREEDEPFPRADIAGQYTNRMVPALGYATVVLAFICGVVGLPVLLSSVIEHLQRVDHKGSQKND